MLRFIRKPETKRKTAYGDSSLYAHIADGTFVPPIKIGMRASAWIESEVEAVMAARAAGKSKAEVRILVADLVAKRGEILNGFAS